MVFGSFSEGLGFRGALMNKLCEGVDACVCVCVRRVLRLFSRLVHQQTWANMVSFAVSPQDFKNLAW